jgi:DNA-binding NarL/FixJ family response regulator
MNECIRLVIADDHAIFREGLASILTAEPDFEVLAQASNANEAVQKAKEFLPDLILLDIDMPGSGLWAAQVVTEQCPVTKIVMLTASEDNDHLMEALKIGARAYVLKGVAARELTHILRSVAAGESYVPPALAASMLKEMSVPSRQEKQPHDLIDDLTEREREILEGLASGFSNREIAQKTFLSEKTVKHYMTNLLQKLQVRNRVEAALLAQKSGKISKMG